LLIFISYVLHFLDGSTNKKQAEHQAAKVALQNLSGILNGAPISDTEKNFKGKLKECLDKLGLKNPVYETKEYKKDISEELVTSGVSPHLSNCEFVLKENNSNSSI